MHTLSPESQQPSDTLDNGFAATDGQPVFSESWPSTDCGSPPASAATSSNMGKPKQSARAGKFTVSSELGVQQDSVLAKYALVSRSQDHTLKRSGACNLCYPQIEPKFFHGESCIM